MNNFLSKKNIPNDERLIIALDFPDITQALELVDKIGLQGKFYKIGLELFMTGQYYTLVDELKKRGKKIFADLKFFDIPITVARAIEVLSKKKVDIATIHGNDTIIRAAIEKKGQMKIMAVTVLTSLDEHDINSLGFDCDVQSLVFSRAKKALQLGCDGIISSGLEVPKIRQETGDGLIIICPGIRPVKNSQDDQKRTVSVPQAFYNGADYIVIGRTIKQHPKPLKITTEIQQQIKNIFENE